jgi:uncharacterized protein (TIGR02246 family)
MKIVSVSWIGAVLLACATLAAQDKPQPADDEANTKPKLAKSEPSAREIRAAEIAAVRATSEAFENAFNQHDAKSLAELWTADGDYIDESGRVFAGREAIEKEYKDFFAVHDDVQISIVIDSLRLLSDNAAIEDGRAFLEPPPEGAPATGRYTAVHVKVDGQWLMSTVRDVRVETPSAYHSIADLEWLIGTWTAEEHGGKMTSVCRWVANKSFIERSYTATHPDKTTTTGVQLIGFNPAAGHVQSWNFSSDGGHAVGVWSARENGWQAEIEGVTGEGVSTTAINLLTRIDDNAYAWQSVRRTASETSLPDTAEIVFKRQAKPAAATAAK